MLRKDFVMPILVLSVFCLVISGALAFTNSFTAPIVADAARLRAEVVRGEIIPDAADFELVEIEGLPESVREVYRSSNDVGYIFVVVASGYGGDMKIILGLAPDGSVIQSKVLEHSETKGLGSKIEDDSFAGQFDGLDIGRFGAVDAISGATISSNAYAKAVCDALEAFGVLFG